MIGAIVITHGELARALLDVVADIAGDVTGIETISIGHRDSTEDVFARIRESMARIDQGDGIVIFTDMFGGTPTNIALTFLEEGRVEVVAGVNLPLLIKFVNKRSEMGFKELLGKLSEEGKKSIIFASKMLKGKK
ncbi:MAG TPA: hypothetical protein ENK42_04840 [Deltaproteobacteria bacterium]|nr:hypothetical protein [Deltaproteobacteria bacterium]